MRFAQQPRDAIRAYSRALELDPAGALPLLGRAQAHEAIGDVAGAIRDYRAALALDPDQALVWANVAALEHEQAHFDAALEAIEEAIRRQPDAVDLHSGRATVLEDLGRRDEAAETLRHCLALGVDGDEACEIEERLAALSAAVVDGPSVGAPALA